MTTESVDEPPTFSAVVVTYRPTETLDDLREALSDRHVQTVVVYTGGYTGSQVYPGQSHIAIENVGYGTACNAGVRHLLETGRCKPWLLLLNDDILLDGSAIERLNACARHCPSESGAILVQLIEDSAVSKLRKVPRAALSQKASTSSCIPASCTNRLYPKGAAICISADHFLNIGGFDSAFFMYFEETDLFIRLYREGGFLHLCDTSPAVRHVGGGTTSGIALRMKFELGRSAAIFWTRVRRRRLINLSLRVLRLIGLWARALCQRDRAAQRHLYEIAGIIAGVAAPHKSEWWYTLPHSPPDERSRIGRLPRRELG